MPRFYPGLVPGRLQPLVIAGVFEILFNNRILHKLFSHNGPGQILDHPSDIISGQFLQICQESGNIFIVKKQIFPGGDLMAAFQLVANGGNFGILGRILR